MEYKFTKPCLAAWSKATRLEDLSQSVHRCTLCPRLQGRTKVLSSANGITESRILFVAEAPGRLGADRTGIPLFGDRSGDNFERLLTSVGWRRNDVFVTNAILCNPREEDGNNGTPSNDEIANCSAYLEMTIELVNPDVIVTLGAVALNAVGLLAPHSLSLSTDVSRPTPWLGRLLVPLYHPGPRARLHRSLAKQRADFIKLAKLCSPVAGISKTARRTSPIAHTLDPAKASPFQQLILGILQTLRQVTYFKMTKLLYLSDYLSFCQVGHTITGEVYLRQTEGPWPPALRKALAQMENYEVKTFFVAGSPVVRLGPSPRFSVALSDVALGILSATSKKYGHLDNATIKTATYMTTPMRHILREERRGKDLRRIPVLTKDSAFQGHTER